MPDLLILAHGGTWDLRFQVSSLAASTAVADRRVEIALFFGALAAWVEGRWDVLDPAPPVDAGHLASIDPPILSEMLAPAREAGRLGVFACSASARFLGYEFARVQESVDALLGWQTFSRKIEEAGQVVTF